MSLFLSFLSVLQTLIQFNEWSKRRHTLHRMVLVVPFFAVTILYRVLALALILAFAGGKFGLLPVFGLLLTQVCYHFTLEPDPFFYKVVYSFGQILGEAMCFSYRNSDRKTFKNSTSICFCKQELLKYLYIIWSAD